MTLGISCALHPLCSPMAYGIKGLRSITNRLQGHQGSRCHHFCLQQPWPRTKHAGAAVAAASSGRQTPSACSVPALKEHNRNSFYIPAANLIIFPFLHHLWEFPVSSKVPFRLENFIIFFFLDPSSSPANPLGSILFL